MKRLLAILLTIVTVVVIVFASMDRREGLWHTSQESLPETTQPNPMSEPQDSVVLPQDSTQSGEVKIEIEPLIDTTTIDL